MLISVVNPAYNASAFLSDAIQSVLEQTYKKVECLVIDDGSTDETPAIAGRYRKSIWYIRKENGGVSSARNAGIRASRGELVAFLDADDVWLPHKLEIQSRVLAARPDVAMCYSGLRHVDQELRRLYDEPAAPAGVALRNTLLLEQPYMSIPSTALVKRAVAVEVGLFDERLSTSADTDFACRVALTHEVAAVTDPLVLYRRHPQQMHHDALAMKRDMELVFEKIFSDPRLPESVSRLRRRAEANLNATVAGHLQLHGRPVAAVEFLLRAFLHDPVRTVELAKRRVQKRKRLGASRSRSA